MHNQVLRMVYILNRRRWHSKTSISPMHFLFEKHGLCASYSILTRGSKLTTDMKNTVSTEQPKPYQLSLLAKIMLAQNIEETSTKNVDAAENTDNAVNIYSAHKQKMILEVISEDIKNILTEQHFVQSQQSDVMFDDTSQDEVDKSVESIAFPQDLHVNSGIKPSPLHGTEDQSISASSIPCVGCGAHLHCQHKTFPGFLPSELFKLLSEAELKVSLCQRCYYIRHCDAFVEVSVKPDEFADMISQIRPTKSVVMMVVDVMDIQGSIVPNLMSLIGYKHPLIVVGNKADLLAPDGPDYLKRIQTALQEACHNAGLRNIHKCTLVSAKTGFGIEKLIGQLFSLYKQKVDVFIVGTANAGKSSLFNTLLASDYCKNSARDLIQRATISPWPGTTLNLLKFPIMRPSQRTVALRQRRLRQDVAQKKEQAALKKIREAEKTEKASTWELREEITLTDLRTQTQIDIDSAGKPCGQVVYGYDATNDGLLVFKMPEPTPFEPEKYEQSYWTYDTPGIINPDQIVNLLTPEEAPLLSPASMIVPQCLFVQPGDTVFVSGLARLDYVKGEDIVMFTVHTGPAIPIHIVTTDVAEQFYGENIGTSKLGVPLGNSERLENLPSLDGRDFTIEAVDKNIAVADIQLSSLGWVSVALRKDKEVVIRAYTPGSKGLNLRTPSLMPTFLQFKGKRKRATQFFSKRPAGSAMINKDLNVKEDF